MFGADLDALGLKHLADVKKAGEVLGFGIVLEQIVVDDRVAFIVLLMREHHRGKDIYAIFRFGEGLDGLHLGKGLESIFRDETWMVGFVG